MPGTVFITTVTGTDTRTLQDFGGVSGVDEAITVTAQPLDGSGFEIVSVHAKYSGPVTASVAMHIASRHGAGADQTLPPVNLMDQAEFLYTPGSPLKYVSGNALVVEAPAGGPGVTCTVTVTLEAVR